MHLPASPPKPHHGCADLSSLVRALRRFPNTSTLYSNCRRAHRRSPTQAIPTERPSSVPTQRSGLHGQTECQTTALLSLSCHRSSRFPLSKPRLRRKRMCALLIKMEKSRLDVSYHSRRMVTTTQTLIAKRRKELWKASRDSHLQLAATKRDSSLIFASAQGASRDVTQLPCRRTMMMSKPMRAVPHGLAPLGHQ
jgi:hypothetical protein